MADPKTITTAVTAAVGLVMLVGVAVLMTMDTTLRVDLAVPDVVVRDLDGRALDLRHGDWLVNVWLPG